MKKTLLTIALALAFVGGALHYRPSEGLRPAGFGTQVGEAQASFTATTLAAAITTPISNPGSSIPATTLTLASGAGVTTSTLLYVDRELMQVTSIANSPRFSVVRGVYGSIMAAHASGAPVRIGLPNYFGNADKSGACTATAEVALPYINVSTGTEFQCSSSVWVRYPFYLSCGTVVGCVPSQKNNTVKTVFGTVALTSASPSTATVTGIAPAFTSSSTYLCAATPVGNTATIAGTGVAVVNVSGSSFTLTGPDTVTTVINYVCIGT